MKKLSATVFFFSLVFLPIFAKAVPSERTKANETGFTYECGDNNKDGNTAGNCTFEDLVAATRKVVNWGVTFALAFSVVVIAVVGGRYMVYATNSSKRQETNAMLFKVLKGIVFILAAWLIVTLITNALLGKAILVPNPS